MTETATETPAAAGPDPQHPDRVTVDRLQVFFDFLIVRALATSAKNAGGVMFIPDTAGERERSQRGIVLAVGPGDWNEAGTALVPMNVQVGDLVFFGKYAGTEEELDGERVLVMRESELRFCVRDGRYRLVEHDDHRFDHLVEDWCPVCHGVPVEQAAAERLALEREAQRLQRDTLCGCGHLGARHAHTSGPCSDCPCMVFHDSAEIAAAPANRPLEFGRPPITEDVESRPCAEASCFYMQVRSGNRWRCRDGHEHPVDLEVGR
jgi:chaperonin GroES